MPSGPELQAALWSHDNFADDITAARFSTCGFALLEAPVATATTFKIPIEDVPLGARVLTKNPRRWEYDDSLAEPDETTWLKISLSVERQDGAMIDAELIRPTQFVKASGLTAGHLLPFNIPELQVQGLATVTSIEPCPPISTGDGSVITGRFTTRQVELIARAEILGPDGKIEVLAGTTIHPIWSVDRQDWVPLGELLEGEQLQAATGIAAVLSITIQKTTTAVYNIEVRGEHVYEVGSLSLLAHNTCGTDVLQRGGHKILPRTANGLNEFNDLALHRREWGRALEALKHAEGLGNVHRNRSRSC